MPAPLGLDDEQVRVDQAPDDLARVGAPRDRRGVGRREALQHGGVEQEALGVGRQPPEHLLGQVVEVGAAGGHPPGLAGHAAGARGEQEPRDPALGALVHLADLGLGQAAGGVLEQRRGLVEAERQLLLADHGHASGRDPGDRGAERATAGHREVHVRGEVGREQRERVGDGPLLQRVDVVEGQHELVRDRGHQLVGERDDLVLGRATGRQGRGDPRERLGDAGGHVGDQHVGRAQAGVAGEPDPGQRRGLEGLHEQRRLAVAGAGHEREHSAAEAAVHPGDQLGPRHAVGRQARRQQARAEDAGRCRRLGCSRSSSWSGPLRLGGADHPTSPAPSGRECAEIRNQAVSGR